MKFENQGRVLFVLIALAVVAVLPAIAKGGAAGATSNVPVTSTVHNAWNVVSPVCAAPSSTSPCPTQLASDNVGAESASYASSSSIISDITSGSSSEWRLDLTKQNVRTVYLSFANPVPGSAASPVASGYYNGFVFSRCFSGYGGTQTGWLAIKPGTSNNVCAMRVTFTAGSQTYYLILSPGGDFPGTGWASVTCNSGDSSGNCNSWTAVPNMTPGGGNSPAVADLVQPTTSRGTTTLTLLGQYYVTFHIDVTNP